MLDVLKNLVKQGALRPLDYQLAKYLVKDRTTEADSVVAICAALVSFDVGSGHVCLSLKNLTTRRLFGLSLADSHELLASLPDISRWASLLLSHESVSLGESSLSTTATPLIVMNDCLYLHRYWAFEQIVASWLRQHAEPMVTDNAMSLTLDTLFPRSQLSVFSGLQALKANDRWNVDERASLLTDSWDIVAVGTLDWRLIDNILVSAESQADLNGLEQAVPLSACLNWQKIAAAMALTRRFSVISGGPGTGKTTTVAKLLAALVMRDRTIGKTSTIKLVAPTGKAAARLKESISLAIASLPVDADIRASIPTEASTLHRLLGAIPNNVHFRHDANNPLHLDVLVVDEASMVDLPMMARLIEALPDSATLILLGDRDQLSSVEAGAVLGDICSFADQSYSAEQAERLNQLTGYGLAGVTDQAGQIITDSLCILKKSYRFHANSGIGLLASAINSGNYLRLTQVWDSGFKDIQRYDLNDVNYQTMIRKVAAFYRTYLDAIEAKVSPKEVLSLFGRARLLCALREGDFGVSGLNQRIERTLTDSNHLKGTDETWYVGRPVMIVRNDYALGLFNGDIGIAIPDPNQPTQLRVFFELSDGTVQGFLPSRLSEHETVFAMTIHKSQGSEFEDTVLIFPQEFNPLLTRELVYTGVTRAKSRLYLFADNDVMKRAIHLRTQRESGLIPLLSGEMTGNISSLAS